MPDPNTPAVPATPATDPAALAAATVEKLNDKIQAMSGQIDLLSKQVAGGAERTTPFGVPAARTGEDPLTSRGFSFAKLIGAAAGAVDKDRAKVEIELCNKLGKHWSQNGFTKGEANSILVPLSGELIASAGDSDLGTECTQLSKAGMSGADPEYTKWAMRKYAPQLAKDMSWLDSSLGGAVVGPPQMGELIDILRPNAALMAAGCRTMGLPPNGRIQFPRQTGTTTAYWVGQNQTITNSDPALGDVVLTAKKLAAIVRLPNELLRFASVSVEAFVRAELGKNMALTLDKALLEGKGDQLEPKGIINFNLPTLTATTTGAAGDTFEPEDVLKMVGTVEENNAVFKTFLMRPLMYVALANRRADAAAAGDKKGPFMFNLIRGITDDMNVDRNSVGRLAGYPVVKSTLVSKARVKGAGTTLTYILGGDFSDYLLALNGAMEFAVNTMGDTPFTKDQTHVRAITMADGAPLREGSFALCDTLVVG